MSKASIGAFPAWRVWRPWPEMTEFAGAAVAMALVTGFAINVMMQQAEDESAGLKSMVGHASGSSPGVAPHAEMMIAAYGGAPFTYPSNVTIRRANGDAYTAERVSWRGEPFIDPPYYGVRIARWFGNGMTGTMLDFTHSKTISSKDQTVKTTGTIDGRPAPGTASISDVFRRLEFSHGHNMLTLNGLMRLGSLHPRIWPYLGIGAGINLPHTEVQQKSEDKRTYEYQYTGPVVQALAGLEFRLSRTSYFIEYKFTLASYDVPLTQLDGSWLFLDLWRQFNRWRSSEAPPGGRLETTLTSHQIIAGAGIRIDAGTVTAP